MGASALGRSCSRQSGVFSDRTAALRQVYKAHDKRTGELVALKKIKMNSDKEGVRQRAPGHAPCTPPSQLISAVLDSSRSLPCARSASCSPCGIAISSTSKRS